MKKKYDLFLKETRSIQMRVNAVDFPFFKKKNTLTVIKEECEVDMAACVFDPMAQSLRNYNSIFSNQEIFILTKDIYTYEDFLQDSQSMQMRVNKRDSKLFRQN